MSGNILKYSQGILSITADSTTEDDASYAPQETWTLPNIDLSQSYLTVSLETVTQSGRQGIRVINSDTLPGTSATVWTLEYTGYQGSIPSPLIWTSISVDTTSLNHLIQEPLPLAYYRFRLVANEPGKPPVYYSEVAISTGNDANYQNIQTLLGSLSDITSDGKLTTNEKIIMSSWWSNATGEKTDLDTKASTVSVSASAYDSAYSALSSVASSTWQASGTTDISSMSPSLYTLWSNYWTERTKLQNAITNNAQTTADSAMTAIGIVAADNIISVSEKPGEINRYNVAAADKDNLINKAKSFNLGYAAFSDAWNALNSYILSLDQFTNASVDTPITAQTYWDKWFAFETEKTKLIANLQSSSKSIGAVALTNTSLPIPASATFDGIAQATNTKVLLANQTTLSENGIYTLSITNSSSGGIVTPTVGALGTYASNQDLVGSGSVIYSGFNGSSTSGTLSVDLNSLCSGVSTTFTAKVNVSYSTDGGVNYTLLDSYDYTLNGNHVPSIAISNIPQSQLYVKIDYNQYIKITNFWDRSTGTYDFYNTYYDASVTVNSVSYSTQVTSSTNLLTKDSEVADGEVYFVATGNTYGGKNVTITRASNNAITLTASDTVYETKLSNPPSDGYVLSSTTSGVKSWIPAIGTTTGVINVSMSPYNATGNGTSDDTTAIQGAIDAANSNYVSTGTITSVMIPRGYFSVSTLTMKSGVYVVGSGWGTVIKARANNRIIRVAPDGVYTATLKDCRVENLMIDGQMRNNPSWATGTAVGTCQGFGIECAADPTNNIQIDNVYVYDTRLEGGYFYRIGVDIGKMKVKYCGLGTEADGSGLAFDSCYTSHIDFLDARDVRGQWGCVVQSSTYPMTICDIIVSNTYADGICVRGAENVSFLGGSIDSVSQRGVNIRGDVGGFGPCKDIYIGPLYINNSLGGYDGISVYQVNNVTVDCASIHNCPIGIGFEGGSAYGGHQVIAPTFGAGVVTEIYEDAVGTYSRVGGGDMISSSFNGITGLASAVPLMDGTAVVGTSTLTARQDHVHPVDTSRQAALNGTGLVRMAGTTVSYDNSTYLTGTKVDSFNSRTGAVTLTSSDVTTALNYTPINKSGDTGIGNLSMGALTATTGTFSGNVNLPSSAGSSYFKVGNGDAASMATCDIDLAIWNGFGLWNPTAGGTFPNQRSIYFDVRNGAAGFGGGILATTGSFSGALSATTGSFSGALSSPSFVSGILKGNGSTISAAVANTDYITPAYTQSKGVDLVVNGTGLLKSNYNFSSFTFDGTDAYYSTGCFSNSTYTATVFSDELMPVDPNQVYKLSVMAKSNPHASGSHAYIGVALYDADGLNIQAQYRMYQANTLTTLAADLVNGATTIQLTSAANWNNAAGANGNLRGIIVWNYVNSLGYAFPALTYSRNVWLNIYADGGISGNTITLSAPWAGGTIPAGTQLSNSNAGASYSYIAASHVDIPATWTNYSGYIGGVDLTGTNNLNAFAPGTAAIKLLFLLNRDVTGNTTKIANVSFKVRNVTADLNNAVSIGALTATTGTFSSTITGTSFNSITGLASVAPLMDGTAAVGTSTLTARQDHVHPVDTSRQAALNGTGFVKVSGTTVSYDNTSYINKAGDTGIGNLSMGALGTNGKTPQTSASVNAACTDLATAIALINQLRTALIANGICM